MPLLKGTWTEILWRLEKVELKERAQLIGDLKARTLVIEEGVVFVGKCNVNPDGFKMENPNFKEGKKEERKDQV